MLIDSLPNTSQQSTPTQWWCVLHFSAISNNNLLFLIFNYIILINFFLDILGILKPIIHPRLQQWTVLSYQLISFLLERRKLFLGIVKMIIIIN